MVPTHPRRILELRYGLIKKVLFRRSVKERDTMYRKF
jgi:hypothetical protein